MSNNSVIHELEELRRQVAELHRARDDQSTNDRAPDPPEQHERQSLPALDDSEAQQSSEIAGEKSELEKQVQEFVDALDAEIKTTNPMTVLVVFALGIVIGRLLPR